MLNNALHPPVNEPHVLNANAAVFVPRRGRSGNAPAHAPAHLPPAAPFEASAFAGYLCSQPRAAAALSEVGAHVRQIAVLRFNANYKSIITTHYNKEFHKRPQAIPRIRPGPPLFRPRGSMKKHPAKPKHWTFWEASQSLMVEILTRPPNKQEQKLIDAGHVLDTSKWHQWARVRFPDQYIKVEICDCFNKQNHILTQLATIDHLSYLHSLRVRRIARYGLQACQSFKSTR